MEYKTAKEMLFEAQQRLQEEARQQAAEALKREIDRTRDNVQTRQDMFEEKIEKKRKHEEEMRLAEIARLEMLTKLAGRLLFLGILPKHSFCRCYLTSTNLSISLQFPLTYPGPPPPHTLPFFPRLFCHRASTILGEYPQRQGQSKSYHC